MNSKTAEQKINEYMHNLIYLTDKQLDKLIKEKNNKKNMYQNKFKESIKSIEVKNG